mgnify:CR=1 FL=1
MVRHEPDPAILEIARAIARGMAREDHARMHSIDAYTVRLTLWAIHPDADLSGLPAKLGIPAADIWKKGSPIISSKGRDTGRLARQSRCSFEFVAPQDAEATLRQIQTGKAETMRPERSPSHASQWLNPGGRLCRANMFPLVQFELASANRIVFTASRGPMMGGTCNTTTVRRLPLGSPSDQS